VTSIARRGEPLPTFHWREAIVPAGEVEDGTALEVVGAVPQVYDPRVARHCVTAEIRTPARYMFEASEAASSRSRRAAFLWHGVVSSPSSRPPVGEPLAWGVLDAGTSRKARILSQPMWHLVLILQHDGRHHPTSSTRRACHGRPGECPVSGRRSSSSLGVTSLQTPTSPSGLSGRGVPGEPRSRWEHSNGGLCLASTDHVPIRQLPWSLLWPRML